MGRLVSGRAWHQTGWMPVLAAPSSIDRLASDVPQTPAHYVHRFEATDRLQCDLGFEFACKILALRFTHNLLLVTAGYHLNSLSENWGPLYGATLETVHAYVDAQGTEEHARKAKTNSKTKPSA